MRVKHVRGRPLTFKYTPDPERKKPNNKKSWMAKGESQLFTGKIDLSGVRSIAELQQKTGLSRTTVYRLSREPGFPAVRVGRRVILDGERLSVWLSERQAGKKETEPG